MATSTSDGTEHEPAERPEPRHVRQFWELREDDKRLLFITIVGGLVANVGVVLILGLGLVEAHLIHRYRHSLLTVVGLQILIIGTLTSVRLVSTLRHIPGSPDFRDVIAWRIGLGIAVSFSAILILGLVGYAAGVK